MVAVAGKIVVAVRRAAVYRQQIEPSATQRNAIAGFHGLRHGYVIKDFVCLLRVGQGSINTPFQGVPQHIEEPPRIWLQTRNRPCLVVTVCDVPFVFRQQRLAQPVIVARDRLSSARIFPF